MSRAILRWGCCLVAWSVAIVGSPSLGRAANGPDLLGLRRLAQQLPTAQTPSFLQLDAPISENLPDPEGTEPLVDPVGAIAEAQGWIDAFATHQVVFEPTALERCRVNLTGGTEEAARAWLDHTRALRQRFDSEGWLVTEQWLAEFFAAQAVYSRDELQSFRAEWAALDPDGVRMVLDHLTQVHRARQRAQVQHTPLGNARTIQVSRGMPTIGRSGAAGMRSYSPSIGPTTTFVTRQRTYRPLAFDRRRSLSQRVSTYYIYRSLWGNNNGYLFWLVP